MHNAGPRVNLNEYLKAIFGAGSEIVMRRSDAAKRQRGNSSGQTMQRASTKILFDYWNQLRGSRSAPERKDVDPTRIRQALGSTFILESNEGEDFSFRLAGSHLCSAYCRELKGRPFSRLWHDKDRDAVGTLIRAVTEDFAVALVTFEATTSSNSKLSFETILMPLRHNGSSTSRILGGMTAVEEPYWFGAQPIMEQRITGLRLIWPDDLSTPDRIDDLAAEFTQDVAIGGNDAMSGTPAKIHGRNARRYNHLAVIDGGRTN